MANQPGNPSTAGAQGYSPVNGQELYAFAYGNGNAQSNFAQAPGTDGLVYMGPAYETPDKVYPGKFGSPGRTVKGNNGYVPVDYAAREIHSFGPAEREIWEAFSMHTNGYVPGLFSAEGNYRNVLLGIAQYQASTGKKMGPFEYMVNVMNTTQPYSSKPGSRGGGGGGASSRTIVDLTNPMDAEVLVDNALTQYLGRQANRDELENFIATLNKVERRNPVTVTQSGRSGGVNQQIVAEEFAQAQPLAAETAAATQYMGWLVEALREDESGGIQSGL
jgi:hypothetical protein